VNFDKTNGPKLFFDEPVEDFDQQNEQIWPPKNLDLSSLWATTIIEAFRITARIRNARWPAVFTSKGLTAGYIQKGCAAKTTSTPKLVTGRVNSSKSGPLIKLATKLFELECR